ncbi:uncharacterized protein LOC133323736 [Musca vetustissima]|uniref:uncharacterized protein LOC133323736 n=1 Tax=Musca vetustissima TaxID=27455 RepID=UPI002AB70AC1|nr:uncharacterized protein LOC133323736 [Musca vetustissima]
MSSSRKLSCLLFLAYCMVTNIQVAVGHQRTHRAAARSTGTSSLRTNSAGKSSSATAISWLGPEFQIIKRVYDDCQAKDDFMNCLKQKALNGLGRAIEQDSIKIFDGVVLEKQNQTEKQSIIGMLADARALNSLGPLDRALLSKIDKLVRTHSLKVDMSVARYGGGDDDKDHSHKHKKKEEGGHVKYVIAALLTAMGIAGPIGLKALAAIAGKALVISKVALTIASIIALKKLFSHDGHEETSFQVHAGDHNRRNTYVIRPVPKTAGIPAGVGETPVVDPYRYYYEYH